MNLKENWWKFIIVILVIGGLIWWRQQQSQDTQNEEELAEQLKLEQQVNDFLEEEGIELPEDSNRINLKAIAGIIGVGVVSQLAKDDQTEYTVVVDLEDREGGWYEAWLVTGEKTLSMGKLRSAKGGYVVDFSTDLRLVQVDKFVISWETSQVSKPTEIVLESEVE